MPTALPSDLDRTLARMLREWIEIPSVTGDEAGYAESLARALEQRGLAVEREAVAEGRFNLLARAGEPRVVFCTHLDTVPPYFGSSEDAEFVRGRGACDAKGQAASMLAAAEALLTSGEDRVGFLFTVGEEIDSIGAVVANQRQASPWTPAFTIVGEPTDGRFVRAHKGVFKARLCAHGVAGHSSQNIGPSAVHELVACLARVLATDWGNDPVLGRGSVNVGLISGGIAPNVVAPEASASILARLARPFDEARRAFEAALTEHVTPHSDPFGYGPITFALPADVSPDEAPVVAFGTDAPYLDGWGERLLFGPGAILDAHTDHEKIAKRDLASAAARHVDVVRDLLARVDAD